MSYYARDCRAKEKVEETINLDLDDTTNGGILLMAQNEKSNTKEDGDAKDDSGSLKVVESIRNDLIHNGLGKIAVSENRRRINNRRIESLSSKRGSSNGRKSNSR